MEILATSRAQSRDHGAVFDSFLTRIGQGLAAYLDRLSRADEVRRLDAMSDAELAEIGIRRDEIVWYVFRDKLYA